MNICEGYLYIFIGFPNTPKKYLLKGLVHDNAHV